MVDRIRYPTVSYLPFYYVFFQFLLLTIFNLQANILTTKDILSNLDWCSARILLHVHSLLELTGALHFADIFTVVIITPELVAQLEEPVVPGAIPVTLVDCLRIES